jgi:hypothetical protein
MTNYLDGAVTSNHEFIDPAVKGTLEILKPVKACAPT